MSWLVRELYSPYQIEIIGPANKVSRFPGIIVRPASREQTLNGETLTAVDKQCETKILQGTASSKYVSHTRSLDSVGAKPHGQSIDIQSHLAIPYISIPDPDLAN